jgi:hypothetical protein
LIVLRHIRIEITLPVKLGETGNLAVQQIPGENLSTAALHHLAPATHPATQDKPGQTFVFGSAPNALGQDPHHIFDFVLSWTCVSSPKDCFVFHNRGKDLTTDEHGMNTDLSGRNTHGHSAAA